MDKTQIVITETFLTDSEAERKERLQKAVDLYLYHQLQNGSGSGRNDMRDLLPVEQGG